MKPEELIQRSPEWFAYRAGRATGSRISDIITRNLNGKYSAKRATYMKLLVAERLSGKPQAGRNVRSMDERSELEPEARAAYEFYKGCEIQVVGFIDHPRIQMAGCSPDGLVSTDGMAEFKVPDAAQHCEMIETEEIDAEYLTQMHFGLACSGRLWCDFGSYCPTMPEDLKLWTQRISRDEAKIEHLEKEVEAFLAEVDRKVEQILARSNGGASCLEQALESSIQIARTRGTSPSA